MSLAYDSLSHQLPILSYHVSLTDLELVLPYGRIFATIKYPAYVWLRSELHEGSISSTNLPTDHKGY